MILKREISQNLCSCYEEENSLAQMSEGDYFEGDCVIF